MAANEQWWEVGTHDVAEAVFAKIKQLDQYQSDRAERNNRSLKLYGNYAVSALSPLSVMQAQVPIGMPESRLKFNIVASAVDTVCAKISKIKTKITFLTTGGSFAAQTQAKQLTKFMMGLFDRNKIHDLHKVMFKDACIFDIGVLKHYRVGNRIVTERIFPNELLTDPVDSANGTPTYMFQVKLASREQLLRDFPKKKVIINQSSSDKSGLSTIDLSHYITVVEAWKVASDIEEADGRHVICVEGGTLLDEQDWAYTDFPFTFSRWVSQVIGFNSDSLASRITSYQLQINKMLQIIQRSFDLGSQFKVFLEYGSKVVREHVNNQIGGIIYYSGTKPDYHVPKVVSNEMFQFLDWLIAKGYEEAGISQLSAAAKKPAGIESRPALREIQDVETERFILTAQSYEDSFLETAKHYMRLCKEIEEEGLEFEVVADSKKFAEKIKWADVAVEGNEMVMQRFPTSMLPNTPAGRLQFVQDMVEGGMIDPDTAMELMSFPDLENPVNLKTAGLRNLAKTADNILSNGLYRGPEPYQNLRTGLPYMTAVYLDAVNQDVEEDRLDMLRRWIGAAESMIQKAAEAAQAAQAAAAAPPPGASPPPGAAPPALPPGLPSEPAGPANDVTQDMPVI